MVCFFWRKQKLSDTPPHLFPPQIPSTYTENSVKTPKIPSWEIEIFQNGKDRNLISSPTFGRQLNFSICLCWIPDKKWIYIQKLSFSSYQVMISSTLPRESECSKYSFLSLHSETEACFAHFPWTHLILRLLSENEEDSLCWTNFCQDWNLTLTPTWSYQPEGFLCHPLAELGTGVNKDSCLFFTKAKLRLDS